MTSRSSLVSYLLLCINTIRGFWAREATGSSARTSCSRRTTPRPRRSRDSGPGSVDAADARLGRTVAGLPTGALAEEILTPGEGQIRALLQRRGLPDDGVARSASHRGSAGQPRPVGDDRRVVLADRARRRLRVRDEDDLRDAGHDPGHRGHQVPQHRVWLLGALRAIHARPPRPTGRFRSDRGLAALLQGREAPGTVDELAERLRLASRPHGGAARARSADMECEPTTDELFEIMCAARTSRSPRSSAILTVMFEAPSDSTSRATPTDTRLTSGTPTGLSADTISLRTTCRRSRRSRPPVPARAAA